MDLISRLAAISLPVKPKEDRYFQTQNLDDAYDYGWYDLQECIENLPSAQPDIKQAAKLLSDFIESCPGGDSYLITPDGEELRTDWGYATEGIQLIHEWAERKTDGCRD